MKLQRVRAKIWSLVIAFVCLLGLVIVQRAMLGEYTTTKPNLIDLSGEWLFIEGKLVTSVESDVETSLSNIDAIKVPVPAHWNQYDLGRVGNKAFGMGTFVRSIKLPPDMVKAPLALRITNVGMAYKVYVNGVLKATMGNPGGNPQANPAANPVAYPAGNGAQPYAMRNVPQIIPLVVENDTLQVAIQVANWDYAPYGGLVSPIYLGRVDQVQGLQNMALFYETIFNASYIIVGLIFLVLYMYRRKAKFLLHFALYNFTGMVYIMTHGEKLWYLIAPNFDYGLFTKIQYGSAAVNLTFLLFYVYYSFPSLFRNKITKGLIGISFIFYPAVLLPLQMQSLWSAPQMALFQVVAIYLLYKFIYGILIGEEYAWYVGFSAVMSLIMVTNAIFSVLGWSALDLWIVAAQLAWVLMHAFLIAARLSKTYDLVEEQAKALERQDQIKDTFLAKTSHEFRTPLHGIINITELFLERNAQNLTDQDRVGLVQVTDIAKRLSRLVNDLLEIAKLNEGKIVVHQEGVDVLKIVQHVVSILRVAHADLGPRIEVTYDDQEDNYSAIADKDRFKQVLINLVDNALMHTSSGRVCIHVQGVASKDMDQWIQIDVRDFGHGIPPGQIDLIFEPFHSQSDFEHSKYLGVGLGLSIVKELVKHMRGRIEVKSTLHEGTVFSVFLPRNREPQTQDSTATSIAAATSSSSLSSNLSSSPTGVQYGHILVVDDEPANLLILQDALGADGYAVQAASLGQEAMALLGQHQNFDLVILDVMLPDISGYQVAQMIRQAYNLSELPILFLTAGMGLMDAQIAFKYGGNDFLTKPFHLPELRARAKTLVTMKQAATLTAQYEVAFLNAQIKPHFLYNALNTIAAVCERGSDQAVDLIISLARYLRGTLDFSNLEMLSPLDRELDLVRAYLAIEKARFPGLVIEEDLDPNLPIQMPTLALQVLVENAIKHSYKDRAQHMLVHIKAESIEEGTRLSVVDNGPGMTDSQVEQILVQPQANQGIGLYNLNQRLMRMIGSRLEIDTEIGRGTGVSFVVKNQDPINK